MLLLIQEVLMPLVTLGLPSCNNIPVASLGNLYTMASAHHTTASSAGEKGELHHLTGLSIL